MSEEKQSTDLQKTSNTDLQIENEESSKINGDLKIPEDNMCSSSKSRVEPQFAFSFNEDEMCIDKNNSRAENGLPLALSINNEESGESNINSLFKDKMCFENKFDSENILPPTTIDVKQANKLKINKIVETNDKFEEMWTFLQQDTSNFNNWLNIMKMVDCNSDVDNARMAYSKFLELYPLCSGYWIEYANFEKKNDNLLQCKKILEDGLNAIPTSVDLWIEYTTCLRVDPTNQVHQIRSVFEKSLKSCGLHFNSDQLWKNYISWEEEEGYLTNATKIYYRLIRTPTESFQNNFFNFKTFIHTNLPERILDLNEFHIIRGIIIHTLTGRIHDLSTNEPKISTDIINSQIRNMVIESWHKIHMKNNIEFENRKVYENNIKKPYYHVNELESPELENWKNYINFEKTTGNHERIKFLYERCLIAYASTEGFWLDYLDYLSSINDDVSSVFKRALFHHSKSLQLNLKYFDFSKRKGRVEIASDTLKKLYLIFPTSKDVATRMMNAGNGENQD